ncbi:putative F-box protein At5g60060 [Silene latifolia]|uniref:putative F-box protein At5g60060 n=1 Tax=Silene latifolia TaxID=37657 RepID=UPI003D77F296
MDQHSESTVTTSTAEWSKLPSDILQHLVNYIDLTLDLPRIRGVCSSWRTSLPLNKFHKPPSYFRVPKLDIRLQLSILLIQSRFYLISPLADNNTTPWLVRIAETGLNKWHLLNPFNVDDYFHSDPPITTRINLLDFRVIEVAKPWSVQVVSGEGHTMSKKVVGGWNLNADYIFAVLAQLEVSLHIGEGGLMFKRLHDRKWVPIKSTFRQNGEDSEHRILDTAYHNGLFYAFELVNWKVGVIDPTKPDISSLIFMDAPDCHGESINDQFSFLIDGVRYILNCVCLVPCNEQLYLVIGSTKKRSSSSSKTTLFVFVLKQGDKIEESKWERVTNLVDHILFIGYDVSFGVSSSILPNWKPGSICTFRKPFPLRYDGCTSRFQGLPEGGQSLKMISYPEYWRHLKMYNLKEEEKGFVGFEELSMKEYTGLFFPPPAWVKWSCPTLDNVEFRLNNLKFSRLKKSDVFSGVDVDE